MADAHELETLVVKLVAESSTFKQALDDAVKQTKSAASKVEGAVKTNASVISNMVQTNIGQIKEAAGAWKDFGMQIGQVAAMASAAGGVLAYMFIDAASTVEQYKLRLEALLGSAAEGNRLFEEMADLAGRVPHEYEAIMGSATALAGVMKGGVDEVAKWMPLISDLAAVADMPLKQTTSQIIKMYSAGAAAADSFRENGILGMLGFTAGVKYSVEETRQMLMDAWNDPESKFKGAADAMGQTWKGVMSMLQDKWFNFRKAVMESGVFEHLTNKLIALNNYLTENWDAIENWIDAHGELITKVVMSTTVILTLIGTLGTLGFVLFPIIKSFQMLATAIRLTWVAALGPVGLVIVALVAVAGATYHFREEIDGVIKKMTGGDGFIAVMKKAWEAVKEFATKIYGFLKNITTNFKIAMDWIANNWQTVFYDLGQMWVIVNKNFVKNFLVAIETLWRLWVMLTGRLAASYKKIFSVDFVFWVWEGIKKVADILANFVLGAYDTLKGIFTGDTSSLSDVITKFGENVAKDFNQGFEGSLLDGAKDIMSEQLAKMNTPLEGFKSNLAELPEFVTDLGDELAEAVKEADPTQPDDSGPAAEATKLGGLEASKGQFKVMSLNQFAVNPVAPVGGKNKTTVEDTGTHKKLDELISATKFKQSEGVMVR